MSGLLLYSIVTYLIGIGAIMVDITNNDFDYVDFILFLLSPVTLPVALGAYLNSRIKL